MYAVKRQVWTDKHYDQPHPANKAGWVNGANHNRAPGVLIA
jgi:hypothetical protein